MIRRNFFFLLSISLFFFSCSPLTYHTLYDSQTDPTFVFGKGATIGLMPLYWTKDGKKRGADELTEKVLLNYVGTELTNRGAQVSFIPVECLKEEEGGLIVCTNMDKYPDLTVTLGYATPSGQVNIPSQMAGYLGKGGGYVASQGSYSVNYWSLAISCGLWSGAPEYKRPVWRGNIVKGSPQPNLSEQAQAMVHDLFLKKFLRN